MATVAGHQQTAFTTPVNSTTADATQVLSNDNTLRTAYNAHDADATIHIQSSLLADRPAYGTAGRVWLTTDGLLVYYDTGSAWSTLNYLPLTGGTLTGGLTISSGGITVTGNSTITGTLGGVTTLSIASLSMSSNVTFSSTSCQINADSLDGSDSKRILVCGGGAAATSRGAYISANGNEYSTEGGALLLNCGAGVYVAAVVPGGDFRVRYDASNYLAISSSSAGAITYNAVGASSGHSFSDLVTTTAGLTVSSGQTLTLTGVTVAGTPTWSSAQAITVSTAAQPNITSVGTLTSLNVGAITSTGLIKTTLTTQQLSLNYDASNHLAITVSSAGATTLLATGAGASIVSDSPFGVGYTASTVLDVGGTAPRGAVINYRPPTTATASIAALSIKYYGAIGSLNTSAAIGIQISTPGTWIGTVTDAYQLLINSAGAATNSYGIYIHNITAGTTLNYALYTNTGIVHFGGEVRVLGDTGGVASANTITGTSDVTANSTGVGSIKFKGTTSRDSSGFIKIYIGTTAYYVPVFSAITG